ncbi:Large Neutral Amino Acids Transporter Small Subunit 3 [Manis pentadactyla]|nr:Large Neutral Amino Acids Transporter Small Subunit 3 [Manis pentadactyla]
MQKQRSSLDLSRSWRGEEVKRPPGCSSEEFILKALYSLGSSVRTNISPPRRLLSPPVYLHLLLSSGF